jgi:hypothetical protein
MVFNHKLDAIADAIILFHNQTTSATITHQNLLILSTQNDIAST